MAGKLQVGHCLADHRMHWTAYLWAVPGKPGMGFRGEVKGRDLRQMRERVAERLNANGSWWVLGDEERGDEEASGVERSETAATG